eukprot:c11473_g1_i3.p1 GENE.c11473_g1_i3~~c11473_g1_i3.p1  ORF type:complete len:264 (+),score=80.29 c11473_g1_i3:427-1218(+)
MQAASLVIDDVMDCSLLRRGKPCWYRTEGVGIALAINDALILESMVYFLLKRHCKQSAWYIDVLELVHEVVFKTELGQMLDLIVEGTNSNKQIDVRSYTMEMYDMICVNKTAHYTFSLPVLMGMHVAGAASLNSIQATEQICCSLGKLFQVQDDFLDTYGNVDCTGKDGTDIAEAKCSWLIVTTLQNATPEQTRELLTHYGKQDEQSVARVKVMYDQIGIPELYKEFCDTTTAQIQSMIEKSVADVPTPVFEFLLNKINQRTK